MSNLRKSTSADTFYPTLQLVEKENIVLRFLYHTKMGRFCLRILISPWISKGVGKILSFKISQIIIPSFQKKNNISMDRFTDKKYNSFNDFFCRSLKENPKSRKESEFCAPCDGKLSVYPITENLTFSVKHSTYSLNSLLQDDELAKYYKDGWCLIFRLTPDDYHRYHFIDNGTIEKSKKIKGVLHTVRPIALETVPVFIENAREITIMNTENFGKVTQIEVGALLVGKIKNHIEKKEFQRFEEKGMFEFGGSTIILLLEKNKIELLPFLEENTNQSLETIVHFQDVLGTKKGNKVVRFSKQANISKKRNSH